MVTPHSPAAASHAPRFPEAANGNGTTDDDDDESCAVAAPTLLQPRIAAVLGVAKRWHPLLFACRLVSICPAIWHSLPIALRLLQQLHTLVVSVSGEKLSFENQLRLTETSLAMIWCGASAYLSFFFTDCLMSRWLINYTPLGTVVRLVAINCLNGYLTTCVLQLGGGSDDPRLLLPAWIAIATILTTLYHITQRKINIHKETTISISVFSGASFISMVSLLVQLYWNRPDRPSIPLIVLAGRLWVETSRVAGNYFQVNATRELDTPAVLIWLRRRTGVRVHGVPMMAFLYWLKPIENWGGLSEEH